MFWTIPIKDGMEVGDNVDIENCLYHIFDASETTAFLRHSTFEDFDPDNFKDEYYFFRTKEEAGLN